MSDVALKKCTEGFALQWLLCEGERHVSNSHWVECWREQKFCDGLDNSLSWALVFLKKLPKCHHNSVFIT